MVKPGLSARSGTMETTIPGLSLVAVYNDKIIGHILFAPISIESEEAHVPAVALAPLSVCLEHQCQGVGSILVEEGLKACRAAGAPDRCCGRAPYLLP